MNLPDFHPGYYYNITIRPSRKRYTLMYMNHDRHFDTYTTKYPITNSKGKIQYWHYETQRHYYTRIFFYNELNGEILYFTKSEILHAEPYHSTRI